MRDSFMLGPAVGFVTGVIIAGVVGFAASKILWHWRRVTAIQKAQDIKSTTDKAPCQVLVDGCKSLFILIILLIVFLACLVGILLFVAASALG